MRNLVYERRTHLPVSPSRVFEFHLDPANLRLLSPGWAAVTRLVLPPRFEVGARLEVGVRVLGLIPQRWCVEITRLEPPRLLVDQAVSGPFPFWRHTHSVTPGEDGGTDLLDRVEYRPPAGILGVWMDPWTTRPMLELMFRYRHARTRALLDSTAHEVG
ncbi:MAG: SRPBCC family protein [Verrucomicrobiota bacterium]